MSSKFILISVLLSISTFLFGQTQISNVQYLYPNDHYWRKGFVALENDEYFIEQGAEGTLVSRVTENNEFELIHNLKFRPGNSIFSQNGYSFENSNSGMVIEGDYFFEIYGSQIHRINIVTGELEEIIDLREHGLYYYNNFSLGTSYIYFNASAGSGSKYVRYDRETKTFDQLNTPSIKVEKNLYYRSENYDSLSVYNLETKQVETISKTFNNISNLTEITVSNKLSLWVQDDDGFTLIQDNNIVLQANCTIPEPLKFISIYDGKLVCSKKEQEEVAELYYLDPSTCEISLIVSFPAYQYCGMIHHKIKGLEDKYLLLNVFQTNYMYNLETNELVVLSEDDFNLQWNITQTVRYGNIIFMQSIKNEYHSYSYFVAALDLDKMELKKIQYDDSETIDFVIMGEKQHDRELNVIYYYEDRKVLYEINPDSLSIEEIKSFDYLENRGIYRKIQHSLWSNRKYFFSTYEGIYALENEQVTKLTGYGPDLMNTTSPFQKYKHMVYAICKIDEDYYAVKINTNNLLVELQPLPDFDYLGDGNTKTENSIVILDANGNEGYYDVISETYQAVTAGNGETAEIKSASGQTILFREETEEILNTGGQYFTLNTVTKERIRTGINPDAHLRLAYPDGRDGYFVHFRRHLSNTYSLNYLDPKGSVHLIEENFDASRFDDFVRSKGDMKTLAFDGPEHMILLSMKGEEYNLKRIPDGGLEYYQTYQYNWHINDKRTYIDIYNGTDYDTYSYSFNTQPELIRQNTTDRLIMVIETDEKDILVYKNKAQVISFFDYNLISTLLKPKASLQTGGLYPELSESYEINDSTYQIFLNDGIHGLEPWTYNINSGELKLRQDINKKPTSSLPADFTVGPDGKIYFTALTENRDRQMFVLDKRVSEIRSMDHNQDINMLVYPSPSKGLIKIKGDQKLVQIFNLNGRLVYQLSNYKNGSMIDLSHLRSNSYIVKLHSHTNEEIINKIVLIQE